MHCGGFWKQNIEANEEAGAGIMLGDWKWRENVLSSCASLNMYM